MWRGGLGRSLPHPRKRGSVDESPEPRLFLAYQPRQPTTSAAGTPGGIIIGRGVNLFDAGFKLEIGDYVEICQQTHVLPLARRYTV
jgi:hypothetical protein